jgi:hypothetical protein
MAMATAALMLAHQVAAKAFRDATFLTAWPASALPLMTVATAALTLALVPAFSRLLSRFSPTLVVGLGLMLSATLHGIELAFFNAGPWIAVVIYLHLAGVGAVLLSGFWSLVAERFDPGSARTSYGRIAAAGTAGGLGGTIAAERLSTISGSGTVLVLLATLHVLCTIGVVLLGRAPVLLPHRTASDENPGGLRQTLKTEPVRTIAGFVILTSATTAILDFLFKSQARDAFGTGPELLRFFATFYGGIQILTFVAQARSDRAVRRLGVGRTIESLPSGVAAASAFALIAQGWPITTALRAVEGVLRNSLFRNGYELLFVPMDSATRRRAKTALDVLCDRAGEAAGSGLVQLVLLAGAAAATNRLLALAIVLAGSAWWLGQRFGSLYVGLIEDQLLKYHPTADMSFVSEAGWTLLQLPDREVLAAAVPTRPAAANAPVQRLDPELELLSDLRSRDIGRVSAALARKASMSRMHVAQIVDLLAWDPALQPARSALEQLVSSHTGMLVDAMLDQSSDFVVRRRLPRILATVASEQSLLGLVQGLDDPRFEVRYYCSRGITKILGMNPALSIDRSRLIAIVERELSVPPQRWEGYRLLDHPEGDQSSGVTPAPLDSSRFLEYVLMLLSTIVAREPLDAAVHGVRSDSPGVRALALEYLGQVLPAAVLDRLRELIAATQSGVENPPSATPPTAASS